ncbi:hypothetical protein MCG98_10755 [Ruminococcus sp. OA3]|uniref:hypothetical protein n=1 Tax=Ruminococcus sp. OA3 TaxID=2914164 RepID=UPI001F06C82C|nr:hypothetical protein [Ruminococcus sp. OA3]MCH1983044.1 hypothetical protein [Ruminococcus sp. OA3]
MTAFFQLTKYHLNIYLKSNKFVMPLAVLLALLYIIYSSAPVDITDSFSVSCMFLFLIMVWTGLSCHDLNSSESEQILILRIRGNGKYCLCYSTFLFLISAAAAAVSLAVPLLQSMLNPGLFTRVIQPADIFWAFLLMTASAFDGSAIGTMFCPRVMRDRKTAVILTALAAAVAIGKTVILQQIPVLAFIMWIFPPVAESAAVFSRAGHFFMPYVLIYLLGMLAYGAVIFLLNGWLLRRRGF